MPVLDCCFLQLPNISSLLHFYSSLIFYPALLACLCLLGLIVTLEAIVWKRLKKPKKLSGVTPLWRKSFRSSIFPVIVLWHNQDKNTIRDGGGTAVHTAFTAYTIYLFLHCVTRAPLLYFIRSWVALSFHCESVSQSVSESGIGNTCPDLHFAQYMLQLTWNVS